MPPIIQKILMLQRHQLIRWGTVNGIVFATLSVLFVAASITLFPVFNWQFGEIIAQLHENADIERQFIDSRESIDELRTFALEASEDHKKSLIDLSKLTLSSIRFALLSVALSGLLSFGYGMLWFRAKKLALDANSSLRQ